MPSDLTEASAAQNIKRARLYKARRMARLSETTAQNPREAKRRSRTLLADRQVVLATLIEVAEKKGIEIGPDSTLSCLTAAKLAGALHMWKPTTEAVWLKPILRNNGSDRLVHVLGLLEATRSRLAMQIAAILEPLHPRQFIRKGGRPALDAWLTETLPNTAIVITTDIPSCFDTMQQSSVVGGVPLPGQVKKVALFDIKKRAKHLEPYAMGHPVSKHQDIDNTKPFVAVSSFKRGIPQGAALSSVASEIVIKNLLTAVEAVSTGVQAASHGDNLIILLEDATEEASVLDALMSAVEVHFGPDVLHKLADRKQVSTPECGFMFCGTRYRLFHDNLTAVPLPERLENYAIRFLTNLADASSASDFDRAWRSLSGFQNAHKGSSLALKIVLELAADLALVSGVGPPETPSKSTPH